MFDLFVDGGDIEVYEKNAKSLNLCRKERTFRQHREKRDTSTTPPKGQRLWVSNHA